MKILKAKTPLKISSYEDGSIAFVTRDEDLLNQAKKYTGRENQENLLLKIFHYPIYADLENFYWGKCFAFKELAENTRSPLYESIIVQNMFALHGLAPRVYEVFIFANIDTLTEHYALLTDDVGILEFDGDLVKAEKRNLEFYEKLNEVDFINDVELPFGDMKSGANIINGKLVDWQGARLKDSYIEGLKHRYLNKTYFGDSKYQTVPELEIEEGIRKTDVRYSDLGLSDMNFYGKTVIDVGSSGGNFLNYAIKSGAKYAVGVDWQRVIEGSFELSNYLGYWNIDYFASDLSKELNSKARLNAPYDVAIFTSMTTHVGVPTYLHDLAKLLIVEVNHEPQIKPTLEALSSYWDIKYIKQSTDFGDRAIYHCKNKKFAK